MKFSFSVILILILFSCAQSQQPFPAGDTKPLKGEATAYFAEGCFWHTEIVFQSLYGVRDAVSGYAGGHTTDPSYETVTGSNTGHAECVKVIYDPAKISFESLVNAFFSSHDPTQVNRQGNDVGPQYRSIAFYSNDSERKIIMNAMNKFQQDYKNKKIATEVQQIRKFYTAEPYHQEYIRNHPENSYVRNVSIPDYMHFRKSFKGRFKSGL